MKINLRDYGYSVIQIEVNNTCNMACTFCPLPIRGTPNRTMSYEDVIRIIEQVSHYEGIDFVALHQFGEPLLNRDIWNYIDHCRPLGLRSQLVTNGLLLNEKNIRRIIEHQPNILRISAQILAPDKHEEVRGVKLEQIADVIAALIDADENGIEEARIDLAVNPDNQRGLKKLKSMMGEATKMTESGDPTIYNPSVRTTRPHVINLLKLVESKSARFNLSIDHLDENIVKYYEEHGTDFAVAYDFGNNIKMAYKPFHNGRKLSQYYPIKSQVCNTSIIGILANGDVTLCCVDYEGGTAIGNILEEELQDILRNGSTIIHDLHHEGKLHFDLCKKCLGCPTRHGAFIKNITSDFKKTIKTIKSV